MIEEDAQNVVTTIKLFSTITKTDTFAKELNALSIFT